MAKKRRGKGKGHGSRRRHLRSVPTRPAHSEEPEDQELIQQLRQGLRSQEPLDLLALVSGMVEVTDPRRDSPFAPEGTPDLLTAERRADLIEPRDFWLEQSG